MRPILLHYILEGTQPVALDCSIPENFQRWGEWYNDHSRRRMFRTEINGQIVSTVFLGIDHNYSDYGPPVLFETMIFKGSHTEEYCERYCTYDQAHAGHILTCAMLGDYRLPRKTKKKLRKWVKWF